MDAFQQGANRDVFDRWADAFEGLHALLSFTTTSLDLANPGTGVRVRARRPVDDGDVRHPRVPDRAGHPMRVIDAWFWMARVHAAQLGGVGRALRQQPGTNTGADFLHDHGFVSTDPHRGGSWFSWTWIPHAC